MTCVASLPLTVTVAFGDGDDLVDPPRGQTNPPKKREQNPFLESVAVFGRSFWVWKTDLAYVVLLLVDVSLASAACTPSILHRQTRASAASLEWPHSASHP